MAKKSHSGLDEELLNFGPVVTTLGANTEFEGMMEFKTSVQIDGKFNGEIRTTGMLIVGSQAVVTADVFASIVIVCGEIIGNVTASDRVNILSGGKLNGNIKTAKLKVADGVVFDGHCEMTKLEKTSK